MSSYADTSFLVSLYGRDVNSPTAIALVRENRPAFMVTPLSETEFISIVFAIVARPEGWTLIDSQAIEQKFIQHLQTGIWRWEDLPAEMWMRARELCRRHGPVLGCRALDVLHVASALALAADDFYTFDKDQARLARTTGLRVLGS